MIIVKPNIARIAVKSADTKMFAVLVQAQPLAGIAAINSIRAGYPVGVLKAASAYYGVPDARIQRIANVPASTATRLVKLRAKIDTAATERVFRMSMVTKMALDVFEDQAAAIRWMCQPNKTFGEAAPLDLMDTEPGAVAVRQVLNAIATGGAA